MPEDIGGDFDKHGNDAARLCTGRCGTGGSARAVGMGCGSFTIDRSLLSVPGFERALERGYS